MVAMGPQKLCHFNVRENSFLDGKLMASIFGDMGDDYRITKSTDFWYLFIVIHLFVHD